MRDWQALVKRELGGLALDEPQQDEVVLELAAHLEETFDALLRRGVEEEEAERQTLLRAGNWQKLRVRIQSARSKEDDMNDRVRQFWMPALLTFFLAMVLLMILQMFGPRSYVVSTHEWRRIAPVIVIYVPWLLSLIPIGALGAYLAGRAGASRRAVTVSIVFPVLPYLALFIIALPVSLILDDHVAHNIMYQALLMVLLAWVVLPGVALLAGGLPVQFFALRKHDARRAASA